MADTAAFVRPQTLEEMIARGGFYWVDPNLREYYKYSPQVVPERYDAHGLRLAFAHGLWRRPVPFSTAQVQDYVSSSGRIQPAHGIEPLLAYAEAYNFQSNEIIINPFCILKWWYGRLSVPALWRESSGQKYLLLLDDPHWVNPENRWSARHQILVRSA